MLNLQTEEADEMSVSSFASNSSASWAPSQRGRSPTRGRHSPSPAQQFAAREQMASHYQRLQNIKAVVDTSPPKSHVLRQSRSRSSSVGDRPTSRGSSGSSRTRPPSATQLDGVRCTVNRISYYLQALQSEQKRLLAQVSRQPSTRWTGGASGGSRDLMDLHGQLFTGSDAPFTPRVLRTDAKSRVKDLRVYNEPLRVKPNEGTPRIRFNDVTDRKEGARTVPRRSSADNVVRPRQLGTSKTVPTRTTNPTRSDAKSRDEEEAKYLEFIVEVTDDVLSRGAFSDGVLMQVFRQHTEKRKRDLDADKMERALRTLKEDLGIGRDIVPISVKTKDFCKMERRNSSDRVNGFDEGSADEAKDLGHERAVGPEDDFVDEKLERLRLDAHNFYEEF